ncbi:hypothetical protein D9M72_628230 [compost metagenome]
MAKPVGGGLRVMKRRQVGAHRRQPLVHLAAAVQQLAGTPAQALRRAVLARRRAVGHIGAERPHRQRHPRWQNAGAQAGQLALQRAIELAAGHHVGLDIEVQ